MKSRDFRTGVLMLKFEFKFEQNRKVSWICVKVTPLNRLEYYKILGVGIISFGLIFISVKLFEIITERIKRNGPVLLGQSGHSARPRVSSPAARVPARARQAFKPDGRGPAVSGCEGRERGVRMTGGARLSSPTSRPRRRRAHRR